MKNLALIMFFISTSCFADVYVVTAPDKSVYALSEQDDIVIPDGYSKAIINDKNIHQLGLVSNTALYDFDGNFNFNKKRLSDQQKVEKDLAIKSQAVIDNKKTAITKLIALGLTADEVSLFLK